MEPAVRAVYALNPDFQQDFDIVCCGNTMGNLLRFLDSSERSFRFNLELINGTTFFVRNDSFPKELIDDVWGYGHTFPEAYTSWDQGLAGSVSHQRLIKYTFGGLSMLFRSECDGYLKEKASPQRDESQAQAMSHKYSQAPAVSENQSQNQPADLDELSQRLSSNPIHIGGRPIPQSAIFDIKTRSVKNEINMEAMNPRLWLSQTPNFILAYHKSGHFDNISIRDLPEELAHWEAEKQPLLRGLKTTLDLLIGIARRAKGQKVEVRRTAGGPLEIRKIMDDKWTCLPQCLKARWAGELEAAAESSDSDSDSSSEGEADYLKF
jgi:hypothetical protein